MHYVCGPGLVAVDWAIEHRHPVNARESAEVIVESMILLKMITT